MNTPDILARLIAFDTVSRNSNMALMDYVRELLAEVGVEARLIPNTDGTKANLLATIGPGNTGGVMLSGHTDVVPIDGQDWTRPAFELTSDQGRYYGRGTTDMKGFVACALAAGLKAAKREQTDKARLEPFRDRAFHPEPDHRQGIGKADYAS